MLQDMKPDEIARLHTAWRNMRPGDVLIYRLIPVVYLWRRLECVFGYHTFIWAPDVYGWVCPYCGRHWAHHA